MSVRLHFELEANDEPAPLQYVGEPGATRPCVEAIERYLQYGDIPNVALILTNDTSHGLLLVFEDPMLVAIRSGFASGYGGEAPRGLSYVLMLLHHHGVKIQERMVSAQLLDRLDRSALTNADLKEIDDSRRRTHWAEYISDLQYRQSREGRLLQDFRLVLPFAILDHRITDLAISFLSAPDKSVLDAYRRLEDTIRIRTGIEESGARLFAGAFNVTNGPLYWPNLPNREANARMELFKSVYGALRGPRAHKEPDDFIEDPASEFLVVNHLYRLEAAAKLRAKPKNDTPPASD